MEVSSYAGFKMLPAEVVFSWLPLWLIRISGPCATLVGNFRRTDHDRVMCNVNFPAISAASAAMQIICAGLPQDYPPR